MMPNDRLVSAPAHLTSLENRLSDVDEPLTGRRLGTWKWSLRKVEAAQTERYELVLPFPYLTPRAALIQAIKDSVGIDVEIRTRVRAHAVPAPLKPLPEVRNIIAVGSGKGGVGKSTTAVNMALALAAEGARVGLLDADIYGPSQAVMMGLTGQKPESLDGKTMEPLVRHGLQVMSMAFLIDAESPTIWRGPMVTQALEQLLRQTAWKDLDYLIVDMPPGTGDIHLSLVQKTPVTGAVIVTTPQEIALVDARKGLRMFARVKVPILGVVENMATHTCTQCGHEDRIFGAGGAHRLAQAERVPLLGSFPLHAELRSDTDDGVPTVARDAQSALGQAYRDMALRVAMEVAETALDYAGKFPPIVKGD